MPPTQTPTIEDVRTQAGRVQDLATDLTVTGDDLMTEQTPIDLGQPEIEENPLPGAQAVAQSALQNAQNDLSTAVTEEQERQAALQNDISGLMADEQPDFTGRVTSTLDRLGTPDAFNGLRQATERLNALNTQFDLGNVELQGAGGQETGTLQREVTQNERERAVRTKGAAAQVELLRGNIELAQSIARDASNDAFRQRQLRLNNLNSQLDRVSKSLTAKESDQFELQKKKIEQEQEELNAAKEDVATAIATGAASDQELETLSNDNLPVAERQALAQTIQGRAAQQTREQELLESQATINQRNASAAASFAQRDQRQVETLITRAEGGDEAAIAELGYDPRETSSGAVVPDEFKTTVEQAATLAGAGDKREATRAIIGKALADGDHTQAYSQIANNVEDSLTGTVKSRFANARTDIGVMTSMRDAIEEYVAAGGDTGFLKGNVQDISERFGRLANSKDPEFAALGARLQREFQTYRNIMTGAAFTPEESAEYEAVNPSENKSLDLNLAVINGAVDQLEDRVVNTVETRVSGATNIYEKAITGGADTVETSWDEVESMAPGEQFTIGGTLYEKMGPDNYVEVR